MTVTLLYFDPVHLVLMSIRDFYSLKYGMIAHYGGLPAL